MKIIDIGIVLDNKDPRGFGRIRARNIEEQDSVRANAIPAWQQWTKDDPFVYSPFLPNHINIIPKVEQAVKIIRYDDTKSLQNQEYIPGPFTTPHNFSYQNELSQLTETSMGQRGVKTPAIKSFTGEKKVYDDGFLRPESVGALPRIEDVGISGNYGSDIILTEHGVQLRAGKLIDKNIANRKQKEDLELYPIYSKKHSKISLKKFPTTLVLDKKVINETTLPSVDIKHVFEYDVDDLSNPTEVIFYIYSIERAEGDKYKTDNFTINTELGTETTKLIYQFVKPIESTGSLEEKLQEAYIEVRDFISRMDRNKLTTIDPSLVDQYPHPLFYRPKSSLRTQATSKEFLANVRYLNKPSGFGLLYSETSPDLQLVSREVEVPYLRKISEVDQTFAAVTADNILYLSTTSGGADGKQIDFGALDKYEYTQEDYLMKIVPNTFSSVRGEKLIEILELMTLILLNHTHGIVTPPKYFRSTIDELKRLIARAKQDMVNTSIRIN
jgi:hypothetical protein